MKKLYPFVNLTAIMLLTLFIAGQAGAGNVTSYSFNGSNESLYISNASGLNVTDHWTF